MLAKSDKIDEFSIMKISLKSATIDWLTFLPSQPLTLNDDYREHPRATVPMDEDIGCGWFEIMPLSIGMYLVRSRYQFTDQRLGQLIPLMHMKGELTEPSLLISSTLIGRALHKDFCVKGKYFFGLKQTLFKHVDRMDYQPSLDSSSDIEAINLGMGLSVLSTFLGSELTDIMLEKLRLSRCPSAAVHVLPLSVSKHLYATQQNHLTGPMRTLHAQARVLEYISELAHRLTQINDSSELGTTTKEDLVTQLHEDLVSLEGKVPTLDEIANNYGISARIINDEFKKTYGSSIYNYIAELRLNAAHDALVSTKVPMKVIADNLGYSHVNHFISAFGKKFGYSPGSLRKK